MSSVSSKYDLFSLLEVMIRAEEVLEKSLRLSGDGKTWQEREKQALLPTAVN